VLVSQGDDIRIRLAVLVLALSCLRGAGTARAQQWPCQPADSNSANLVQFVTYLVASRDPGMDSMRVELGLTGVTPSSVSPVSDGRVCSAAAAALDVLAGTPRSGRKVFVVKAGSARYVVQAAEPGSTTAREGAFVFDERFVFIRALLR
jgi:hypothetical protein